MNAAANHPTLRQRTVSAVRWSGSAHLAKQGLQALIAVVLVRLLTPEAYGLLGMAGVFAGFLGIFGDLGFSGGLVQREDLREEHSSTAFWMSVGLGVVLGGLLAAIAGPIARFYNRAELTAVLRVLSIGFALTGLGAVPKALLQRQLAFGRIAGVEIPALVISGLVGIWLAVRGAGVWSLVGQQLTSVLVETALLWWNVGWRPRMRVSTKALKDLWRFGRGLTGFGVINYWARRADDLLVGKVLGAASLGLYGKAYGLMLLPIRQVISAVDRVIFPALATIQHDRQRVHLNYLRAVRLIAFVAFPMMAGLAATAGPFVLSVFGARWAGVIPLIPVLCLAGAVQTLMNPVGLIYTSQGRTDLMLKWGLGAGTILIAALAVGVWIGSLQAVVWSYTAANVMLLWPGQAIPGRLIGMTFTDVFRSVSGVSGAAGGMAAIVFSLSQWLLPSAWDPWARLVCLVPTGILAYAGLVRTLAGGSWSEFWNVVGDVLTVRGTRATMTEGAAVP